MANIPLKSLNFPGLPNTYTVPESIFGPLSTPPTAAEQAQARANIGAAGYDAYPAKTLASAPIQSFSDGADGIPVKAFSVAIEAVQDLHGYANPWPAGGGKNKLRTATLAELKNYHTIGTWSGNSYTQNGLTFACTFTNDGYLESVKVTGTASASMNFLLSPTAQWEYTDEMILSGSPSSGSNITYYAWVWDNTAGTGIALDYGSGVTFTPPSGHECRTVAHVESGYAIPSSGLTFYPMLRLASVSDATFAPYSNYCPIVGWDEAHIVWSGKNIINVPGVTFPGGTGTVQVRTLFPTLPPQFGGADATLSFDAVSQGSAEITFDGQPDDVFGAAPAGTLGKDVRMTVTATKQRFTISGTLLGDPSVTIYRLYRTNSYTGYDLPVTISNIQLELGSTATTYAPYNGNLVTISFGGTVYGGTLEYVGGKEWRFTPTHQYYTLTSASQIQGYTTSAQYGSYGRVYPPSPTIYDADMALAVCDRAKSVTYNQRVTDPTAYRAYVDDLKGVVLRAPASAGVTDVAGLFAIFNGAQIVCPLANATPITLTADAETVTVYGDNVLYADCGDSSLTYRRDPTLALEQLEAAIAALQGGGALSLSAPLSMSRPDALEPAVELTAESEEGAETE